MYAATQTEGTSARPILRIRDSTDWNVAVLSFSMEQYWKLTKFKSNELKRQCMQVFSGRRNERSASEAEGDKILKRCRRNKEIFLVERVFGESKDPFLIEIVMTAAGPTIFYSGSCDCVLGMNICFLKLVDTREGRQVMAPNYSVNVCPN